MIIKQFKIIIRLLFYSLIFLYLTAGVRYTGQYVEKIIAVGDIHGDFDAYKTILTDAGLIDSNLNWSGGTTVFVQTGDIADRGPDTRKIINHLKNIQKQAPKAGGQVIALIGNHEAMNMTGDLRYVDPGEYEAFKTEDSDKLRDKLYAANQQAVEDFYRAKNPDMSANMIREAWNKIYPLGRLEHQRAWSPKGEIGKWVVNNPAVVLIDGNLFVHGGLSQEYASLSLKKLNKRVKSDLKKQIESDDSIIHDSDGPLWYRGNTASKAPDNEGKDTETELEAVLGAFGADRLIVGHTPGLKGIKSKYNGRLIQIDTGASKYYGGTRSFLRIENGHLYAHNDEAEPELLNSE